MIVIVKNQKKPRGKKLKLVILAVLIFFTISFSLFILLFEIKYGDKFFPGVTIGRESVAGKSYTEVKDNISKKINLINNNGIIFNIKTVDRTKEVKVPTFFTGLTTDKVFECFSLKNWEDTLKTAYSVGRNGSLWQKITDQFDSVFNKKNFNFNPVIQKTSIESFLNNEMEDFLTKTSPAQFTLNNGEIIITPEIIGEKIDTDSITGTLKEKLVLLDASSINLTTKKDIPLATKGKLQKFLPFALQLNHSVSMTFHYKNYVWNVNGNTLATWLTIKSDDQIGIDEQKLENYFNKIVTFYIDSPMQNSRFQMINNKLVEIAPGRKGNVVDIKKNIQKVDEIISNLASTSTLETQNQKTGIEIIDILIETTEDDPRITKETISKYKIKELVGYANTNFEGGSLDRQHNIETGVSKLNGVLLAPGEEFSALKAIGEVTVDAGFVEEYVISGGKTQKEIGGGLCQLSTTLFRLALNAGLPISERTNHRYVISYYGAGLDATIYDPQPDLKFINDTGNYLLLQSKTQNNEVTFEFYGKKDGRLVKISEPKLYDRIPAPPTKNIPTTSLPTGKTRCSEIPHSGVTADVTYTVYYPGGETKENIFHSVYQPWQKVCLVGI